MCRFSSHVDLCADPTLHALRPRSNASDGNQGKAWPRPLACVSRLPTERYQDPARIGDSRYLASVDLEARRSSLGGYNLIELIGGLQKCEPFHVDGER
jgi:hypothetical protein